MNCFRKGEENRAKKPKHTHTKTQPKQPIRNSQLKIKREIIKYPFEYIPYIW